MHFVCSTDGVERPLHFERSLHVHLDHGHPDIANLTNDTAYQRPAIESKIRGITQAP